MIAGAPRHQSRARQEAAAHRLPMTDPLAYFLAWHTYGTWLQGDRRGSVNRKHHEYGRELIRPNAPRQQAHSDRMVAAAVTLSESMRTVVQQAVIEVCEHRSWSLHALHVRTNHIHAVVTECIAPERVVNDFKSYATRALRQHQLIGPSDRVWSRHGSKRYLWKVDEVTAAIDYVVDRQGVALIRGPVFSGHMGACERPLPDGRGSD